MFVRKTCYAILTVIVIALALTTVNAAADELSDELFPLGLSPSNSQIVTTSRIPRPISKIAENVTVITAEQIATLNAHTLADVLNTVPGIQMNHTRTPGSLPVIYLQGKSESHVRVLIDGVPQNELAGNFSDTGSIPAHYIERIEIIKGAASAAWGPALAGVVNVITKSPDPERKIGGSGFASYGERGTSDLHLDASGTLDRLGYYLSGNTLYSKGFRLNNGVNNKNLFGKFTYDLPSNGTLTLGLDYRDTDRGIVATPDPFLDYRERITARYFSGYLSLTQPLAEKLTLDLLYREWHSKLHDTQRNFADTGFWALAGNTQAVRGATAKLSWGDSMRSLVGGVEFEHAKLSTHGQFDTDWDLVLDTTLDDFKRMDRYGIFANGSWSIGALTLLPGIRYDRVSVTNDNFSYTLGATYQLTDSTTLRAYAAKAYSLPYALQTEEVQKVNTVQAGFESSVIPHLWLKGTFFYNIEKTQKLDLSVIPNTVTTFKYKRQGGEIELKSTPLYGFSLGGGYTYTYLTNKDTGEQVHNYPKNLAKIALNYSSTDLGLKGVLTGNYVWWNGAEGWNGHYNPVIWDISLTQKLFPASDMSPEIFFSGHNLFNGSQHYLDTVYNNTRRWIEGGVRFKF